MTHITFTSHDGHDEPVYYWSGGAGAVLKSYERGVKVGDVRSIREELLAVYVVKRRWLRAPEVWWHFPGESYQKVAQFKAKVLR